MRTIPATSRHARWDFLQKSWNVIMFFALIRAWLDFKGPWMASRQHLRNYIKAVRFENWKLNHFLFVVFLLIIGDERPFCGRWLFYQHATWQDISWLTSRCGIFHDMETFSAWLALCEKIYHWPVELPVIWDTNSWVCGTILLPE